MALDVLSYVLVIAALLWWRREADADDGLREHFGGALRAACATPAPAVTCTACCWRAALFFAFASAVWALLPIVARQEIGGGPGFYGLMLGSVGAGAIAGALLLPRVRARLGQDRLVLGRVARHGRRDRAPGADELRDRWRIIATFVLGIAWIAMLTTLNGTTQAILPNWMRGRGLAIYLTVFNGAMAAGSLGWGFVAQAIGDRCRPARRRRRPGRRGAAGAYRARPAERRRRSHALAALARAGAWPSRSRMTAGR